MFKKANLILLAPIPALAVGAMVMHANGISLFIYGQNLLCYGILAIAMLLLRARKSSALHSRITVAALFTGCILVAASFMDRGLEGVHRWLSIGSFRLHIASIVVPCAIVGLSTLLKQQRLLVPAIVIALLAAMLTLQPDASQIAAFAAACILLSLLHVRNKAACIGILLTLTGCSVYAWLHLDSLAPVAHVEEILLMAQALGNSWFILGILSLAALLIPFVYLAKTVPAAKAVCAYYIIMMASTFVGHFPMPVMGQGISPIIGYMLAVYLLLGTQQRETAVAALAA